MNMNDRTRMARAIAEADQLGPDDFDQASESERGQYDRMALAALNHRHTYAIHTTDDPRLFRALAEVDGNLSVTRYGDRFAEWGEEAGEGDVQHVLIGVSDALTGAGVIGALGGWQLPATVTDHADWSREVSVGLEPTYAWEHWMRETDGGAI